jgi:hypothetical protein
MNTGRDIQGLRALSVGSIVMGLLGGALFWWAPMGIVFSLSGLMLGAVDWISARRRSLDQRLSIVGFLISAAALTLGAVIAVLGLQIITLGTTR